MNSKLVIFVVFVSIVFCASMPQYGEFIIAESITFNSSEELIPENICDSNNILLQIISVQHRKEALPRPVCYEYKCNYICTKEAIQEDIAYMTSVFVLEDNIKPKLSSWW